MASPWRVGADVTVEVQGRRRPGVVVREGPTWFEVECKDGQDPSGYVIPKKDRFAWSCPKCGHKDNPREAAVCGGCGR